MLLTKKLSAGEGYTGKTSRRKRDEYDRIKTRHLCGRRGGLECAQLSCYTTDRGATYNAYLIIDEKIALIDTVKEPFAQELLERIREIVDPEKIDYLISNHVEMDHSGAIPAVMAKATHAVIVTSAPKRIQRTEAALRRQHMNI